MSTSGYLAPGEDKVYEACKEFAANATGNTCVEGEVVFFFAHHRALMPGHIYSESGVQEFRISRSCEWHFDDWFATDEDLSPADLPYKEV